MKTIHIIVYGEPIPQGSMRGFVIPGKGGKRPRAIVTADNKRTKPWKQEIAGAADDAMREMGWTVCEKLPVAVDVNFWFSRPKSTKKDVVAKTTRADLDKLFRSLGDALTGVVFKDDSQICRIWMTKGFDDRPRAEVKVSIFEHSEWRG